MRRSLLNLRVRRGKVSATRVAHHECSEPRSHRQLRQQPNGLISTATICMVHTKTSIHSSRYWTDLTAHFVCVQDNQGGSPVPLAFVSRYCTYKSQLILDHVPHQNNQSLVRNSLFPLNPKDIPLLLLSVLQRVSIDTKLKKRRILSLFPPI